MLARALDVPFALVLRGWADLTNAHGEHGWLRDRSIAARTRWSTRVADALFVLSDVTREQLADRYPVERARTVGRPIPVSRYASNASDPARSRRDERVALTVTNLRYEGKFDGVRTILDGLKSLFERDDSLRYRIAGAGRYLPALREHVAEYPYGERVDVLGWREDVPDLLSAADLFVYVSYLDSISTAVLEAQAAGLLVVAGDAVGVPTAVGNAGLLCDPTTAGVTDGVGRVLEDDSLRKRLAEQSRTKTAGYNVHAAREYVAVWNAVIDDHGTREEPNQAIISATAGRSDAN